MSQLERLIIEEAQEEVCRKANALLGRMGLHFALVCWVPGKSSDDASITIAGDPAGRNELPAAMEAARRVSERIQIQRLIS